MDDDSTRLTDQERRVLAEMELALRRDAPELERNLKPRSWLGPARSMRWMWWLFVVLGVGLLTAGLLVAAVPVAAAGFVVLLIALHELTDGVDAGSIGRRVRGWFGLGERTPEDPS